MRSLTLFGKSSIIKSLGLPKLFHVCSKIYVPDCFISKVKNVITDFIWNGDKPKIKYDTLIGTYNKGGLTYPALNQQSKPIATIRGQPLIKEEFCTTFLIFIKMFLAAGLSMVTKKLLLRNKSSINFSGTTNISTYTKIRFIPSAGIQRYLLS